YDWFEMNNTWRWHYHTTDEEIASGTLNVPEGAPAALSQLVSWGQYRLVVDCRLCRQDSARSEAGRSAGRAANQVRFHHQPDHCQGARARRARGCPRACRRRDRMRRREFITLLIGGAVTAWPDTWRPIPQPSR